MGSTCSRTVSVSVHPPVGTSNVEASSGTSLDCSRAVWRENSAPLQRSVWKENMKPLSNSWNSNKMRDTLTSTCEFTTSRIEHSDPLSSVERSPDANHKGSSICLMTIGGGSTPDRNLSSSSKESSGNLNNPLDDSVMGGTNSSDVNPMDRTGIGDAQLSARKRNEEMFPTPSTKDIAEIDPSELDNFIKYLTIFPDGTTLFANAHVLQESGLIFGVHIAGMSIEQLPRKNNHGSSVFLAQSFPPCFLIPRTQESSVSCESLNVSQTYELTEENVRQQQTLFRKDPSKSASAKAKSTLTPSELCILEVTGIWTRSELRDYYDGKLGSRRVEVSLPSSSSATVETLSHGHNRIVSNAFEHASDLQKPSISQSRRAEALQGALHRDPPKRRSTQLFPSNPSSSTHGTVVVPDSLDPLADAPGRDGGPCISASRWVGVSSSSSSRVRHANGDMFRRRCDDSPSASPYLVTSGTTPGGDIDSQIRSDDDLLNSAQSELQTCSGRQGESARFMMSPLQTSGRNRLDSPAHVNEVVVAVKFKEHPIDDEMDDDSGEEQLPVPQAHLPTSFEVRRQTNERRSVSRVEEVDGVRMETTTIRNSPSSSAATTEIPRSGSNRGRMPDSDLAQESSPSSSQHSSNARVVTIWSDNSVGFIRDENDIQQFSYRHIYIPPSSNRRLDTNSSSIMEAYIIECSRLYADYIQNQEDDSQKVSDLTVQNLRLRNEKVERALQNKDSSSQFTGLWTIPEIKMYQDGKYSLADMERSSRIRAWSIRSSTDLVFSPPDLQNHLIDVAPVFILTPVDGKRSVQNMEKQIQRSFSAEHLLDSSALILPDDMMLSEEERQPAEPLPPVMEDSSILPSIPANSLASILMNVPQNSPLDNDRDLEFHPNDTDSDAQLPGAVLEGD